MGSFLRSKYGLDNEQGFVQGAGRILVSDDLTADPNGIEDFIVLTAGATQYDAVTPWDDVGFTKTGINITRNNAEETFDVDQQRADIRRRPSNWEMSVGTQLAEATLETYALAWSLDDPVAVSKTAPQPSERHQGLGAPAVYKDLQVAVLFQFPDGVIRVFWFRHCVRAAQESGFTLQKTGEQVSLPQRWNALVDPDAPVNAEFGLIMEQVPAP
jgi:hypothetical protein